MQDDELVLYTEHVEVLGRRWSDALTDTRFDAVVVPAGSARNYLFDDQAPPFRPNPHLAQWFPVRHCEDAAMVIRPGQQPRLYLFQPNDYWHLVTEPPDWVGGALEILSFPDAHALGQALARDVAADKRVALIGEGDATNLPVAEINPTQLLARLDFQRAYKSGFEQACMRGANTRAATGHVAARDAFDAGESEFGINLAYLRASAQTEADLPYASIVALNEHAGVLHYQFYERNAPAARHSFLIDAGAAHFGYAADITRTYSAAYDDEFAALVEALDAEQQSLIAKLAPGINYLELHIDMHRRVAELLQRFDLVSCSAEAAFAQGITRTFLPHGLGHLLGLQTHDVAGQQTSPDGGQNLPPVDYPSLRLTREIAPGMAFTIEPGLYFIPIILRELRQTDAGGWVNWSKVDRLLPCGGIRIEDNVLMAADGGVENLTRDAFAQLRA